jgi:hypothetical protein
MGGIGKEGKRTGEISPDGLYDKKREGEDNRLAYERRVVTVRFFIAGLRRKVVIRHQYRFIS